MGALVGVGGQRHAPAALPPGRRPSTHCTGRWVGPRVGLDGCGNLAPPGFDPRTVQPVASRYTDHTIPAHILSHLIKTQLNIWLSFHLRLDIQTVSCFRLHLSLPYALHALPSHIP